MLSFYLLEAQEEQVVSLVPRQKVASIGATTTGPLIDGVIGPLKKRQHQRFSCHSEGPKPGFLGPKSASHVQGVRDQPGVFPAPVRGLDSLTFSFCCSNRSFFYTPVIIKPDGSIDYAPFSASMKSTQILEIPSPAQTGLYTFFILPHTKNIQQTPVFVEIYASTDPCNFQTMKLFSFDPFHHQIDQICGEFIYSTAQLGEKEKNSEEVY